jgi:hypothetical protein
MISQRNFISDREAAGKTVAAIDNPYWDNVLVIKFTDGTFLLYRAQADGRMESMFAQNLGGYKILDLLGEDRAVELGLCSEEEARAWRTQEDEASEASRDAYERQMYEAYKKKFESKQSGG